GRAGWNRDDNRGGRSFDNRGGRDDQRGGRSFDRGGRPAEGRGERRDFDRGGRSSEGRGGERRDFNRGERSFDNRGGRSFDERRGERPGWKRDDDRRGGGYGKRDDDRSGPRRDDTRSGGRRFDDRDSSRTRGKFDRGDRPARKPGDDRASGRFERDDRSGGRFERDDRAGGRFERDDRAGRQFDRGDRPGWKRDERSEAAAETAEERLDEAPARNSADDVVTSGSTPDTISEGEIADQADATGTAPADATGTAPADATRADLVDTTGADLVDTTGADLVDATGAAGDDSTFEDRAAEDRAADTRDGSADTDGPDEGAGIADEDAAGRPGEGAEGAGAGGDDTAGKPGKRVGSADDSAEGRPGDLAGEDLPDDATADEDLADGFDEDDTIEQVASPVAREDDVEIADAEFRDARRAERRTDDRRGKRGGRDLDDAALARELLEAPELPEDIEYSDLDPDVRRELRSLPKSLAETVGKHLVAAGNLIDTDPEAALAHAKYAKTRASRIPIVREALGLVSYHAGRWQEALAELRAVRRMTHTDQHIAVIADAERALGRPERALDLAKEMQGRKLPRDVEIELKIVAAGARRDLGQVDAAVVSLQGDDLDPRKRDPWSARLFYAYADNLVAADRTEEALRWFLHAAEADAEDETDAAERAAELANG
ncbi:hypothetical protein, partial [Amycolatopsis sp. ATCC 39116]|uniref:hypothetical protein n=1 Tax=Amycolatopsis sp. (strain ATCC 39116 / 75iv2) TaxID=385957 RepID=UPI001F48297C